MSDSESRGDDAGSRDPRTWAGRINEILYGLLFKTHLDDAVVEQMTRSMIERRSFGDGPAVYAEAIPHALAYSGPLNDEIETPHSEGQIREFLARLADGLDALKPWPQGRP